MAVSPSHLIPGIEPSADPMLQARLFSYNDSQRHRLGTNFNQIPVNAPLHPYTPWQRDGFFAINGNSGSDPNYPSSLRPIQYKPVDEHLRHEQWIGQAVYSQNFNTITGEDFVQATGLWQVLGKQGGQQDNFVTNVSTHLCDADPRVRQRTYSMFTRVDRDLGKRLEEATEKLAGAKEQKDNIVAGLLARAV
jgi:catalase